MDAKDIALLGIAKAARERAYAPYSAFRVGAAVASQDGSTFGGCNVENISFSLTMCAERVAVGAAVHGGSRELHSIAIVADSKEPVVPCGACRQVLAEFNPHMRIVCANLAGVTAEFDLANLLPLPAQGILESST
jgi:cytidine deaminase